MLKLRILMASLKQYHELENGDQFLTTDDAGKPVKYTVVGVSEMTGTVTVRETIFNIDIPEGYYVIGNIHD